MEKKARQRQGQGSKAEMGNGSGAKPKGSQGFRWSLELVEGPREPSWEQVEELGDSVP